MIFVGSTMYLTTLTPLYQKKFPGKTTLDSVFWLVCEWVQNSHLSSYKNWSRWWLQRALLSKTWDSQIIKEKFGKHIFLLQLTSKVPDFCKKVTIKILFVFELAYGNQYGAGEEKLSSEQTTGRSGRNLQQSKPDRVKFGKINIW